MEDLDRSQREIRKAARDFAKGEFDRDQALEMETGNRFPEKIWTKAGDLGFLGLHFPEACGGGGLGFLESVLVAETFCRRDATIGCALLLAGFGAECLMHGGSDDLKGRFLGAVAEARMGAAPAFREPGMGTSFGALQTDARQDGNHWIIDGIKTDVLNAGQAGFFIVLCRTGEADCSMFVVERERDGVALREQGRRLGLNMTGSARVQFTGVRVPQENLVGEAGGGLRPVDRFREDASILLAGASVGIAAGAFDRALAYVKEREAFGRKLGVFEITRHKIAEMAAKVGSARAITFQAARRHDAGKAGSLPFMARMMAARAAVEVADEAIQLFGGYGYMKESEVERFYRDAKAIELMLGGTGEMKKRIADDIIK